MNAEHDTHLRYALRDGLEVAGVFERLDESHAHVLYFAASVRILLVDGGVLFELHGVCPRPFRVE